MGAGGQRSHKAYPPEAGPRGAQSRESSAEGQKESGLRGHQSRDFRAPARRLRTSRPPTPLPPPASCARGTLALGPSGMSSAAGKGRVRGSGKLRTQRQPRGALAWAWQLFGYSARGETAPRGLHPWASPALQHRARTSSRCWPHCPQPWQGGLSEGTRNSFKNRPRKGVRGTLTCERGSRSCVGGRRRHPALALHAASLLRALSSTEGPRGGAGLSEV